MLGAVAGNIIGSFYELTDIKIYDFELLLEGSRFTGYSVMTIAVAKWIMSFAKKGLTKKQLISVMQEQGRRYPNAGYGDSFYAWLWNNNPLPYNDNGIDAAVRVSPIGLYTQSLDECLSLAEISAEVSTKNPDGIKGAQAVASAIWLAKNGHSKDEIRNYIVNKYNYDIHRSIDNIHPIYQQEGAHHDSVSEAIICFLEGKNFEEVVRFAILLNIDSNAMACIAGSIAAAFYPIPKWIEDKCKELLPFFIDEYMENFEQFLIDRQWNMNIDEFGNQKNILSKCKNYAKRESEISHQEAMDLLINCYIVHYGPQYSNLRGVIYYYCNTYWKEKLITDGNLKAAYAFNELILELKKTGNIAIWSQYSFKELNKSDALKTIEQLLETSDNEKLKIALSAGFVYIFKHPGN